MWRRSSRNQALLIASASPRPAEHLRLGDGAVLEDDLGMLVLGAVHEAGQALDPHAGRAVVDQEERLLAGCREGVHDDGEPLLAAAHEPLLAVDDVVVAPA